MPRLTALIPLHNDDYILGFCLASVVEAFDEVRVLDDASTDHTPEVALGFARRYAHVHYCRHEGRQLGWIGARNALLAQTDSDWLFWLDSDDVLCERQGGLLREIAEGPHPVVRLRLCEMWGDFCHTTQRLRHYDRCHVFVDRRRMRNFAWRGGSAAEPGLSPAEGAATSVLARQSPGPLLFHCKGVKPDRRLVERQVIRRWLSAGRPARTVAEFARLDEMPEREIHRRALDILLRSRQDRIRRGYTDAGESLGRTPPLPDCILEELRRGQRFMMADNPGGDLVDRLDRGWTPPDPNPENPDA